MFCKRFLKVFLVYQDQRKINTFFTFFTFVYNGNTYFLKKTAMDQSVFLAQLLGPILAIVGISLILNQKHYLKMIEATKNSIMGLYI